MKCINLHRFSTLALGTLLSLSSLGLHAQNTVSQSADSDLTRQQLAAFDQFLDSHPELAEQIRKDPSLVNRQEYVENHPDLQNYLQDHPGLREELTENPDAVMHQEQRLDRREDRNQDRDRQDRDRDVTHRELANMDHFMDSHPEIAEQLRKDPSLVDNKRFVESHPALQEFLAQHPGVREEYKENPNGFMNDERRFDNRDDSYRRSQRMGDTDVSHRELANMDHFMDGHPEIAEQLRKDPSLVDNKRFVESHPALQEFLAQHPGVREEYKENPNGFMRQEQSFDRQQDSFMRRDRDVTGGELASFNEFMEDHNKIAGEVSKNPSLATNEEYLENHPDLQQYLASHPRVQEELRENPQSFVKSAQQFEAVPRATPKSATTEPKVN